MRWLLLLSHACLCRFAGDEPELCCGMVRHGMLSERVGSMHAYRRMHYANLVQNVVCTCCAYVGKYENGFVWSDQQEKVTYVKAKDGDTNNEAQVWRGLLVSLVPVLQFVAWVSLLFAFPSLAFSVLTTTHCHHAHEHGSMGMCNISVSREWDKHSLVPSPSPQLSSLAEKLLRVIRTASDDSYGEGLGMRLEQTRSVGWCTCSRKPH